MHSLIIDDMVLEALHELIETLQARIAEHGPALQQSEALTRYALIDPLLRGLGWDTGDPSQVLVEYRSDAGQADYALFGESPKPQVIVEAKKLGTHLDQKVRLQVTGYCQEEGVPFAVITDGRLWEIYDIYQPVAMKDSIVTALDLGDEAAKLCLEALALWRPSVAAGKVKTGSPPLVDAQASAAEAPAAQNPASQFSNDGPWHRLSEFTPQPKTKPAVLMLPDKREIKVSTWSQLVMEVVERAKSTGTITDTQLPIRFGSAKSNFIHSRNDRGNGQRFATSQNVESWHVNLNYNAAQHMRNIRRLIDMAGLDSSSFAVRLAE